MPLSLKQFAESLSTGKVTVRGVEIPIRALKDEEYARVMKLFPEPTAPKKPHPTLGSSATKLYPDESDPAYQAAKQERDDTVRRVLVAVAAALGEPEQQYEPALTDEALRQRLEAVAADIGRAFTRIELLRISNEIMRLMDSSVTERARDGLVVDLDLEDAGATPARTLPENYGTTAAYWKLEVCHYFPRIHPTEVDDIDPGYMAILIAHVRVRRAEEAKAR